MGTVGEELPKEISRVRDEVIPFYRSIGPSGTYAVAWMSAALKQASRAMAEGDTVAMLRAYVELKGATT
jgi:hypothetical protein